MENVLKKKDNMLYAILCCIGLGVCGAIVFGIILYAGYISWIGAYLVVFLAGLGYKMFIKTRNLKATDYIIIASISLVLAVLAFIIGNTLSVISILADEGYLISFGDAVRVMFNPASFELSAEDCKTITSAVLKDALISFVMIVIGILTVFYYDKKNSKAKTANTQSEVIDTLRQTDTVTEMPEGTEEVTEIPEGETNKNNLEE